MKFEPSKMANNQELQILKFRFGGTPGTLNLGREKIEVLRLGENLYASTKKPSRHMETVAELTGADIHPILTGADATEFGERYKNLEGTSG